MGGWAGIGGERGCQRQLQYTSTGEENRSQGEGKGAMTKVTDQRDQYRTGWRQREQEEWKGDPRQSEDELVPSQLPRSPLLVG